MGRGAAAPLGSERWSPNGYLYIKTETGWELAHRVMAEGMIGRQLEKNERVSFKNGNKRDIREENLEIGTVTSTKTQLEKRKISCQDKIRELEAVIEDIDEQLLKLAQSV